MKVRKRRFWMVWALVLSLTPQVSLGGRCATGERGAKAERFRPLTPVYRRAAARVPPPVSVTGHTFATENFRVLWGDEYDRADPQWADSDVDGVPIWVETLADALEKALAAQRAFGFLDPPELDRYLIDAYVGNTGLVVDGERITLSSSYYAYTDLDPAYGGAYLVVNDDFSAHTSDELGVLRATAAHELFHAVQLAYYPWNDEVAIPDARWEREGWWFEATATWMEEECEPAVNDYVTCVRGFLARPELPLTSRDGLREYGAAIFPGYLWLRVGAASFWQEVFESSLGDTVEGALEGALRRRALPGFSHAVASFWSLAAHPEDTWPDGAAFRGGGVPRLTSSVSSYPFEHTASGSEAPGRFGASLFRLSPTASALTLSLSALEAETANFVVALSRSGAEGAWDPVVQALRSDGKQIELGVREEKDQYLAVVNGEDTAGTRSYRLSVEAEVRPAKEKDGGGSSGACFLATLGGR